MLTWRCSAELLRLARIAHACSGSSVLHCPPHSTAPHQPRHRSGAAPAPQMHRPLCLPCTYRPCTAPVPTALAPPLYLPPLYRPCPAARYAIIAHGVHLVNRDYLAMCLDYYALDFMDPSVDTTPIAPALAAFFDDVLNDSVSQLNFRAIVDGLGGVLFQYPFRCVFRCGGVRCGGVGL